MTTFSDYKVADISLALWGRMEIDIAETEMPALMALRSSCGYGGSCFPKDVKACPHGTAGWLQRPVAAGSGGDQRHPEDHTFFQASAALWRRGPTGRQNYCRLGTGL